MVNREEQLEKIIVDTIWMARRYADGRMTYAVSMVNDSLALCKELGIEITEDPMLKGNPSVATDGRDLRKCADCGGWVSPIGSYRKVQCNRCDGTNYI